MASTSVDQDFKRENMHLLIVAGVILFLWLLNASLPAISLWFLPSRSEWYVRNMQGVLQQYGTFGDMYGAFNALVNALTVLGVGYAIVLQRKEIQEQRIHNAKQDEHRRRSDIVAALVQLSTHYSTVYTADTQKHDDNIDHLIKASIDNSLKHISINTTRKEDGTIEDIIVNIDDVINHAFDQIEPKLKDSVSSLATFYSIAAEAHLLQSIKLNKGVDVAAIWDRVFENSRVQVRDAIRERIEQFIDEVRQREMDDTQPPQTN